MYGHLWPHVDDVDPWADVKEPPDPDPWSPSAASTASSGSPETPDETGDPARSTRSAASSGSPETLCQTGRVLDDVREHLGRFIVTMGPGDLDLLALWAAHTHLVDVTYTTPRLILDSPVPASGKTTCLEHLDRLCLAPIQAASLSSASLLTRILDAGMRTILIDEADRSLSPDKEGVGELLAVLNSGYKKGGTRPVLVPDEGEGWVAREMPTYAPVAMAGNAPRLPEDTLSRCIRVLLMPDIDEVADESDWEVIDEPTRDLGRRLAAWAQGVRDDVRVNRPTLPAGIKARARERWAPLKRVAVAAGGRWPDVVDDLAVADVTRIAQEREDGIVIDRPHIALIRNIGDVWRDGETFVATDELIRRLVLDCPDMWGITSSYGKALTAQRLGRMLSSSFNITSFRQPDGDRARGYRAAQIDPARVRLGMTPLSGTGRSGRTGHTGPAMP